MKTKPDLSVFGYHVVGHAATVEDYLRNFDDVPGRLELIDGDVVAQLDSLGGGDVAPREPGIRHQSIAAKLGYLLNPCAEASHKGIVLLGANLQVNLVKILAPDLLMFSQVQIRRLIDQAASEEAPIWAAEVVSPGAAKRDRVFKFEAYQEFGIPHYWIVDPYLKTIDAFNLVDGKYVAVGNVEDGRFSAAPFESVTIDLHHLFA